MRSSSALIGSTPRPAILVSLPVLVVAILGVLLNRGELGDARLLRNPGVVGLLLLDTAYGLAMCGPAQHRPRCVPPLARNATTPLRVNGSELGKRGKR